MTWRYSFGLHTLLGKHIACHFRANFHQFGTKGVRISHNPYFDSHNIYHQICKNFARNSQEFCKNCTQISRSYCPTLTREVQLMEPLPPAPSTLRGASSPIPNSTLTSGLHSRQTALVGRTMGRCPVRSPGPSPHPSPRWIRIPCHPDAQSWHWRHRVQRAPIRHIVYLPTRGHAVRLEGTYALGEGGSQ